MIDTTPLTIYNAIRTEEARTGERVLPEWFVEYTSIPHDAAYAILLGSMAAWCSGRGICVGMDIDGEWWVIDWNRVNGGTKLSATTALSAFGEATLAALRAMPTKGATDGK